MTWKGERRKQLPANWGASLLAVLFAALGLDIVVMFGAGSLAHHPGQVFWTVADVTLVVAFILVGLAFAALLVLAAADMWRHER